MPTITVSFKISEVTSPRHLPMRLPKNLKARIMALKFEGKVPGSLND